MINSGKKLAEKNFRWNKSGPSHFLPRHGCRGHEGVQQQLLPQQQGPRGRGLRRAELKRGLRQVLPTDVAARMGLPRLRTRGTEEDRLDFSPGTFRKKIAAHPLKHSKIM